MADVRYIEKTYIETPDFQSPQEDLTLRIKLTDGEEVLFTAEKEFYTPRRIATNKSDVLELDNVVEYTPNNIAIIKMQNGQTDLNKPQYYINSIVRDVYKQYTLDNFFTELDDELAVPDFIGTLSEQRQLALNALLNLEDLAAAAAIGDFEAANEAAAEIDENFSELAGFDAIRRVSPSEITTPEEEDQLAALDFVGLTNGPGSIPGGYVGSTTDARPSVSQETSQQNAEVNVIRTGPGPNDFVTIATGTGSEISPDSAFSDEAGLFASADTSDDIIDPIPSVQENALIKMGTGVPSIAGVIPGIDTVNSAINTLNIGIQQIEDTMQGTGGTNSQGQQEMITVAPGKKAYTSSGGEYTGATPERKIPRSSVDKRLADVKDDITKQENTPYTVLETLSGVPTLIKIQKSTLFNKLIGKLSLAGRLAALSKTVRSPKVLTNIKGTSAEIQIPAGYKPMPRENVLSVLYKMKDELEKTLSQE